MQIMKNTFGEKLFNNLLIMLADEKFRKEAILIREKFNITENGIDDYFKEKYGNKTRDIEYECFSEFEKLRTKYKLNEHYGILLMYALIFAKVPDKQLLNSLEPFRLMKEREMSGLQYATIKIYPETTIADLQKNWSNIKKFRDDVYGYKVKNQKPIKNSRRDLNIRAMKRWGFKNNDIKKTINQLYPHALTLGYEDIPKIIEKNKKRAAQLLKRKK